VSRSLSQNGYGMRIVMVEGNPHTFSHTLTHSHIQKHTHTHTHTHTRGRRRVLH
jgi:hypothetical protein